MTEMTVEGLTRRPFPALFCACGHMEAEHNLAGDGKTRTRCDVGAGPSGALCGCSRFVLAVRRHVVVGYVDEPVDEGVAPPRAPVV